MIVSRNEKYSHPFLNVLARPRLFPPAGLCCYKDMEIVYRKTTDLIPYKNNPRKNDQSVDYVAQSIREFGWKVPLVITKDNVIVTGHTRLKAAKKLKIKEVPCIIADDLTEDQIKAFRLADNKVAEFSDWDFEKLDLEIEGIDLDLEQFGFEFVDEYLEHEHFKDATQERVLDIHNLGKAQYKGVGPYDMPALAPVTSLPEITEWIGFNYVLTETEPENKGVHFFIDDYQFERIWNDPDKYVDKLRQFAAVATPDFSPYGDMPMATQIFNHYRKQWVGRYLQDRDVIVIPTVRASSDVRSLEWYLDGIPEKGIVMISSMWTGRGGTKDYFVEREYKKMYETLNPCKILLYGRDLSSELPGDIEFIGNFTSKRWDK